MFIQKLTKNRAQATLELAIFGTIMMVIFATLLRYGILYNAKQQTSMYAFRKAVELAQRRVDSQQIGSSNATRKFASVTLNVNKNIYPSSTADGGVQDTTVADASASVLIETEASQFGDGAGPEDLDDIGGTYYQTGNFMLANDSYFEPAYMYVERKTGRHVPKHSWDTIADFLNWDDDEDKEYRTFEPVPYREQEQNTTVFYDGTYDHSEYLNKATASRVDTTHTITKTAYKPPAYYISGAGGLEEKIKDWDQYFIKVLHIVGHANPVDMEVTTDKTFTKSRAWTSTK